MCPVPLSILCKKNIENNRNEEVYLPHHHRRSVRKHTKSPYFLRAQVGRMVFSNESENCIQIVLAASLVLGRLVLEERAILAVPSPSDVLRDCLTLFAWLQGSSTVDV